MTTRRTAGNHSLTGRHQEVRRQNHEIKSELAARYVGVNFTKRNVAPHQSLWDQLNQYISGQLKPSAHACAKHNRLKPRRMWPTFTNQSSRKFSGSLTA